jgi:hypothetical protein
MARRRTRNHKRTKKVAAKPARKASPARRTGKVKGRGAGAMAAAVLIALVAVLAKTLKPLGPLTQKAGTWAVNNRNVRRGTGVVAGVVVLVVITMVMEHNLRKDSRYMLDPSRLELSAEPGWAKGPLARVIKEEIENDLRAEVADLELTSAFNSAILDVVSERLLRNPWVYNVQRIERRFPTDGESHSRLMPVLEIRRPALAIETGNEFVLVDGDGVVLPLTIPAEGTGFDDFRRNLNIPLRIARGVTGAPPNAGDLWANEQVMAALSMERVVRRARLDQSMPIEWIELIGVPQHADERGRVHYQPDGAVVLVPHPTLFEDTRVIWGRPPVHASSLEPSPNDKLDRLRQRLNHPEELRGSRIDLRRRA